MPKDVPNKKRVSAIIRQGDAVLMIRRVKPGEEYYTFPGGTVEDGESLEQAMLREIAEELSVGAMIGKLLFDIQEGDREDVFFLINEIDGEPILGGPEKERMSDQNQYHLEWVNKDTFKSLDNLYPNPKMIQVQLIEMWDRQEI